MTYEDAKILQSYWDSVVVELEMRIQAEMNSLRVCKEEELKAIQARISVYEQLKSLPYDVEERLGIQA